jgi:hypothetical protein
MKEVDFLIFCRNSWCLIWHFVVHFCDNTQCLSFRKGSVLPRKPSFRHNVAFWEEWHYLFFTWKSIAVSTCDKRRTLSNVELTTIVTSYCVHRITAVITCELQCQNSGKQKAIIIQGSWGLKTWFWSAWWCIICNESIWKYWYVLP